MSQFLFNMVLIYEDDIPKFRDLIQQHPNSLRFEWNVSRMSLMYKLSTIYIYFNISSGLSDNRVDLARAAGGGHLADNIPLT